MQTIESLFEKFLEDVGRIEYMGFTAYETTKSELRNREDSFDLDGKQPAHWRRTAFKDAITGELSLSDIRDYSLDDIKNVYVDNLNKQCQWLLVDAYELFEKFLYNAYAYVGFSDPNQWRCSDFGDISTSEIDGKNYQWFLSRVRLAFKNRTDEILKRMRILYPEFAELEINNELKMPLKFSTAFTEKIRHHVVHAGGRLDSVELFLAELFSKTGISENSKLAEELTQYCRLYFSEKDGCPHISMFNAVNTLAPGVNVTHSPLNMACSLLLTHAHALSQKIRKSQLTINVQP